MNTQDILWKIQEDPTLLQILDIALANYLLPVQQQDFASVLQEQSDFVLQQQPQFTYIPEQQLDLLPGPRQQLYHSHSLD